MGGDNKKDLKAYVRFDGNGRVVAGSLILRRRKPRVGKWVEVDTYECCAPSSGGFLLTEDGSYLLQENNGRIII